MNALSDHIQEIQIQRVTNSGRHAELDSIAIEAPLEIRLKKKSEPMSQAIAVTMRTPGNDKELALGFLFTEGILRNYDEVIEVLIKEQNIIEIIVADHFNVDPKSTHRNFYTSSSCGVCGKASIEAIKVNPNFKSESQNKVKKRGHFVSPQFGSKSTRHF